MQPIEPPKKKHHHRPQIAFNLSAAEADIKDKFVQLVGNRGLKPTLMEFMRRFVAYGGRIATAPLDEYESGIMTDPAITPDPSKPEEYAMAAAILVALRDPELCEVHLPALRALLSEELRIVSERKDEERNDDGEGAA